jgi:hypothetical protein
MPLTTPATSGISRHLGGRVEAGLGRNLRRSRHVRRFIRQGQQRIAFSATHPAASMLPQEKNNEGKN